MQRRLKLVPVEVVHRLAFSAAGKRGVPEGLIGSTAAHRSAGYSSLTDHARHVPPLCAKRLVGGVEKERLVETRVGVVHRDIAAWNKKKTVRSIAVMTRERTQGTRAKAIETITGWEMNQNENGRDKLFVKANLELYFLSVTEAE